MEEHLYTLLSGAVSFPVSWGTFGNGTETPRATIYRTGSVQDYIMTGTGPMETTVQIDCYGATFAEAIGAARDIRTALAGYRGGPIHAAFLTATRDGFDDEAQLLQRVSLTFSVHHRG